MAAITVGVPVYNGADLLDECLQSLARQTFADFEVLVFDNASTDATAEIAQAWAARDARFSYHRQEQNIGSAPNFVAVLGAARSDYFVWRAHDDISAPDFLEVTHRLLTGTPKAKLAACTIVMERIETGQKQTRPYPDIAGGPRVLRLGRMMFVAQANWFHGLWVRQYLIDTFMPSWERYPRDWGIDQLAVFSALVDDAIIGTNETTFVKRMGSLDARRQRLRRVSFAEMMESRRVFTAVCRGELARAPLGRFERIVLTLPTLWFANKRTYNLRRLARAWLRSRRAGDTVAGA